jgi:hypothetical protein
MIKNRKPKVLVVEEPYFDGMSQRDEDDEEVEDVDL